jgi:hypothetical protein
MTYTVRVRVNQCRTLHMTWRKGFIPVYSKDKFPFPSISHRVEIKEMCLFSRTGRGVQAGTYIWGRVAGYLGRQVGVLFLPPTAR